MFGPDAHWFQLMTNKLGGKEQWEWDTARNKTGTANDEFCLVQWNGMDLVHEGGIPVCWVEGVVSLLFVVSLGPSGVLGKLAGTGRERWWFLGMCGIAHVRLCMSDERRWLESTISHLLPMTKLLFLPVASVVQSGCLEDRMIVLMRSGQWQPCEVC